MKRLIAWVLIAALLVACAPGAFADGDAPDEPERSEQEAPEPHEAREQEASERPEREPEPERAPESAAPQQTPPPQSAPAQAKSEESAAPDDEEAFEPQGQAWTELEDGTVLDGKLQGILRRLLEEEQAATVYLTKLGDIRLRGIPMALFDRVALEPDEDVLGARRGPYEVTIREGEADDGDEDGVPPLIVTVSRVRAQGAASSDAQEGEPTPDPAAAPSPPRLEPGEVLVGTVPPMPTDEPTPEPIPTLSVEADGLAEGAWQRVPPTFTLSGIEPGTPYVYGVFICGEQLVLLRNGAQEYAPKDEGELFLRFAILDMMGDVVSLSEEFAVWLDMTPPEGPVLIAYEESDIVAGVEAWDALSGVEAISYDGGATWEPFDQEQGGCCIGEKGETIGPGEILVRDRAGNIAGNLEEFTFGRLSFGGGGGGTGSSRGKKIKHAKETTDYSLANYNALELDFPEGPVTELAAGGTVLSLTMTADVDGETQSAAFLAELTNWRADEEDERSAPNALVLSAAREDSELNTWLFSGDVYRLLYNSDVGTAYAKMKAGGMSTKRCARRR